MLSWEIVHELQRQISLQGCLLLKYPNVAKIPQTGLELIFFFFNTADVAVYVIQTARKNLKTRRLSVLFDFLSLTAHSHLSVESILITGRFYDVSGFRCYAKFHRKRRVTRRRGRCVVPESVSSDQGGFITIWEGGGGQDGGGRTGKMTPWQSR